MGVFVTETESKHRAYNTNVSPVSTTRVRSKEEGRICGQSCRKTLLALTKSGIDALGNQATWRSQEDFYDHLTEKEHRPMTTRRQLRGVK